MKPVAAVLLVLLPSVAHSQTLNQLGGNNSQIPVNQLNQDNSQVLANTPQLAGTPSQNSLALNVSIDVPIDVKNINNAASDVCAVCDIWYTFTALDRGPDANLSDAPEEVVVKVNLVEKARQCQPISSTGSYQGTLNVSRAFAKNSEAYKDFQSLASDNTPVFYKCFLQFKSARSGAYVVASTMSKDPAARVKSGVLATWDNEQIPSASLRAAVPPRASAAQ